MKKVLFLLTIVGSFMFVACGDGGAVGSDGTSINLKSIDLSEHGIPVTIKAPEGVTIEPNSLTLETGLTISKGKFNLIVDMYDEYADLTGDAAKVKSSTLEDEKAEDEFSRLVLDEDQGFVWETMDPVIGKDFHFYYVMFKDGKQIEFREDYKASINFNEEEALMMYKAVKQ